MGHHHAALTWRGLGRANRILLCRQLLADGSSFADIAEAFRTSHQAVYAFCMKQGLAVPGSAWRRRDPRIMGTAPNPRA